jgi:transposase
VAVAAARQDWWRWVALEGLTPDRLVFVDESAALTGMVRAHARSPRGERARAAAPCGRWQRLTVIGALGSEGVVGAMTIEAATSGAVFGAFLERVLLPELHATKPDAVIVMDNLSAHKTRAVRDLLERSGFAYRYLPPYSPDLNPIELAWAKVKAHLRTTAARTVAVLHDAVGAALAAVTPGHAAGFFRHAGYAAV